MGDDSAASSTFGDATLEDAGGGATDAAQGGTDGLLPLDDSGMPTYEGQIPQLPDVGPQVTMDCPGDPTQGWTEYHDTFDVRHPYDLPVRARFDIDGGVYTFWIQPGDKPDSPTTTALNPRSEAHWATNFTTGMRMWSGDMLLETNLDHVIVMQVHTTATGIGPVYLHVEGNAIPPIGAGSFPGGLFNKWFNMKVAFDAATLQSQLYINNCPVTTTTGPMGSGIFYFKNGVYHCYSPVCRDHYKNIHLYVK
jgi:hypothetical protein